MITAALTAFCGLSIALVYWQFRENNDLRREYRELMEKIFSKK